jgi:hypothetical protein
MNWACRTWSLKYRKTWVCCERSPPKRNSMPTSSRFLISGTGGHHSTARYFHPTWLSRYPPHEWASYGRSKDTPSGKLLTVVCIVANRISSGSGRSEGYNFRISALEQNTILKVDKMVDFLAKEDKYWSQTLNTSRLWGERKRKQKMTGQRIIGHRRRKYA